MFSRRVFSSLFCEELNLEAISSRKSLDFLYMNVFNVREKKVALRNFFRVYE